MNGQENAAASTQNQALNAILFVLRLRSLQVIYKHGALPSRVE